MDEVILVINAGSSSIKFSLFTSRTLTLIYHGEIESIPETPQLTVFNAKHIQILKQSIALLGYESVLHKLFDWLEHLPDRVTLKAVGHRVVHGGTYFFGPTLITAEVINQIASLNPMAPFHQPHNLAPIKIINGLYPTLPQVACFDTTFHRTQYKLATLFAIPRELTSEGIIRYGFHGISYEYIASILPDHIQTKADGKVIVAHLGGGASMCGMIERKSIATTMGFTALDGLMMGARCGTIDPGVLLYLIQEKKFSVGKISTLLYQESGLLGVSGISRDMRELQSSTDPNAIEAVDLFCYRAAKELCALCAVLEGCEAIIFTAGIGEHSAIVRKKICDRLHWLGVILDEHSNNSNASIISQDNSSILVGVIPTNEEYIIAKHTMDRVSKK
jgi:acetate kinase